ncbi:U1 small nuclear ribonucleoprotein 70 kDa-like [Chironomus tepperi]|uniref:U1 small nuclear ribonucleoprotein 70 kDa-like n=1 Tax=Chironomus tepperi TaxID=113505 RepID=UPI00391FC1DE
MPRSRSRERDNRRRDRSRSRDRKSRSKSRDRDRRRDRSRDRDYKRRDRSPDKYRDKRDKYESYRRRSRDRSQERHKNRSPDRDRERDRDRKRRDSRDKRRSTSRSKRLRSESSEHKPSQSSKTQSDSVKPIVIIANTNKKNKHKSQENGNNEGDLRESFEIANEFSQEGFEQFSRDHGIDFDKVETEEDRIAVHEKMEELLKEHFAAQGKVYPPPKQEKPIINVATGFANDGSFLEQFKKMQDEYKQQQEMEKKRQTLENKLRNLPSIRRRGAKILKTGLVAKTIVTSEGTITTNSYESYYKEVQKYKNASSCDNDPKTRPLVK